MENYISRHMDWWNAGSCLSFFNFLPSWDSMYNFAGTGATYSSGRCFLEFFSKISSKYDMPWVNGALSLLYISLGKHTAC